MYDLYKLGDQGSAMWMGRVQSYSLALLEIELTAAKAPGDYLIVDQQNGQRNFLSFGFSMDGHVKPIRPQTRRDQGLAQHGLPPKTENSLKSPKSQADSAELSLIESPAWTEAGER